MDLSDDRTSYEGKKYEFSARSCSSSEMEILTFSRRVLIKLGSADVVVSRQLASSDSIERLESEKRERND